MVKAHAQHCFCQSLRREWSWGIQPGRMIVEIQRAGMHTGRERASVWRNGLWPERLPLICIS